MKSIELHCLGRMCEQTLEERPHANLDNDHWIKKQKGHCEEAGATAEEIETIISNYRGKIKSILCQNLKQH